MADGPAELKKKAEKREKQRLATKKCREKQRLATKPTQEDNSNQDPLNDAFRLLDKQELHCMDGIKNALHGSKSACDQV